MDVIERDPSLFPAPAPVLEVLQDDEVQRTDIHLVTHSVEDHMVVEGHQGVTFIDQLVLVHVLVRPFDVAL
jgi:L-ascorbate metabolism protein UlaG (beta-lactamase superfamily)